MRHYSSEEQLYTAFHHGEALAIRHVYDLFYKPLCFYAERICNDRATAQDIVTETFIKLLQQRESFSNLANIKSFLYLVTKNACLNQLKSDKRHLEAHRQIKFLTTEGEENTDLTREELIRGQALQAIYAEIENLPDRCREIFKLLFIQQLSTEQISEQLNISTQTVRTQKARALQLLKAALLKKNLLPAFLYLILLFPASKTIH